MTKRLSFLIVFLLLTFTGCVSTKVSEEPLYAPSAVEVTYETINDSIRLRISNLIKSPIQVRISSADSILSRKIQSIQSIVLSAEKDSLLGPALESSDLSRLKYKAALGDPRREVVYQEVSLPLPNNKAVRIIQGHHGAFSHNKKYSRFAIDFDLKIDDTIFAAFEGFAVQVSEGNTQGGKDLKWLDYSNKIIIFNPETGLFFQYSHLKHNGALVEQGDWVVQGQALGLTGMTGYTDIPHLHFNVLVPDKDEPELISVPVNFLEGYCGKDLQKNVVIKRN